MEVTNVEACGIPVVASGVGNPTALPKAVASSRTRLPLKSGNPSCAAGSPTVCLPKPLAQLSAL
ncbi:hypothetical protein [Tolypothrix sp. VBCCA 56010]|uniref:hypothetical protein n=1 Tax=Tolypothrix sp. VBCCA 56010 TaxID=3137731 RepID=UPI003D7C8FD5